MTRKAIVATVGESWIDLLSLDDLGTMHDKSCYSSGCACQVNAHPFRAAVPESIQLKCGDTVLVSASAARALGAFFLVLGLPVLAATAGWFLSGNLFPDASETVQAASAGLGLAVGAGGVILLGKHKKEKNLPTITSVLK